MLARETDLQVLSGR